MNPELDKRFTNEALAKSHTLTGMLPIGFFVIKQMEDLVQIAESESSISSGDMDLASLTLDRWVDISTQDKSGEISSLAVVEKLWQGQWPIPQTSEHSQLIESLLSRGVWAHEADVELGLLRHDLVAMHALDSGDSIIRYIKPRIELARKDLLEISEPPRAWKGKELLDTLSDRVNRYFELTAGKLLMFSEAGEIIQGHNIPLVYDFEEDVLSSTNLLLKERVVRRFMQQASVNSAKSIIGRLASESSSRPVKISEMSILIGVKKVSDRSGNWVEFSVRDTGIGFSKNTIENKFGKEVVSEWPEIGGKSKLKGSGEGMSLVRKLLSEGWEIDVRNWSERDSDLGGEKTGGEVALRIPVGK